MHDSQIPRSCDRCYATKERCIKSLLSNSCERCERLNHECTRKRPTRAPGRPQGIVSKKRRASGHKVSQDASPISPDEINTKLDQIASNLELLPVEADLLRQSILNGKFIEQFVIGPSFRGLHQEYLVTQLQLNTELLGHGYLACALSHSDDLQLPTAPSHLEDAYSYASKAITILRSLAPSSIKEMGPCLALGTIIVTFSLKLQVGDSRTICRQTLDLIKPVYEDTSQSADVNPNDICVLSALVLTDTAESLLCCELPALSYQMPSDTNYVDRFVGVSLKALSFLHDIARLSYYMAEKSRGRRGHQMALQAYDNTLNNISRAVQSWTPHVPAGFTNRFTATETAHMLCQVEVLRSAALLVLHRLKHPYGSEDALAKLISNNIINLLDTTLIVTKSIPRCVDFPLTAACLEIESDQERAEKLRALSPISGYSEIFENRTIALMSDFSEARRNGVVLCWYNISHFVNGSSLPP